MTALPGLPSERHLSDRQGRIDRRKIERSYRKLAAKLALRARWKHGLSPEDADDVVQEAFAVALVKLGSVKNTRAWLEGVVDRLAVNFRRTGDRRAKLLTLWGPRFAQSEEEEETEETRDGI